MVLNRILFFFILSILTPHLVWGFSLERTQKYKTIAQEQKLFENPQWLKLGHYQKSWLGHYHSKIQGNFFLSPQGSKNPEAELLATIDTLFEESEKPAQCRYLARTRWLKSVLPIAEEDLQACPERDEWKKKLAVKEVYIVFASSDLNSAGSSFGHTFLKLHNPANTQQLELLDYGVNYAAITGEDIGVQFALKGIFGFYPGAYSMLPYHQKIREYTNLEGRDIWEYKLSLSEPEVEMLVDHLLELDGSFAYYYFADENCSYQIMELLNVVKPNLELTKSFYDFVIPLDTLKVLNDKKLLETEKSRPSLQAEWRQRYAFLNWSQKKYLRDLVKEPRTFSFKEDLDKKEKAELLEAGLSYLAIKEYREQKELKDEKYALAVQRSKLGTITEPVKIPKPSSPLSTANGMGIYAGYGKDQGFKYLDFKFRRTFHDLLSDDAGFAPFSHVEVMSFEFRYYTELKNLDLYRWTIVNVLSTSPTNTLDSPLSWNIDIGTEPKLAPYVDFAIGNSFDLPFKTPSRWVILARSENRSADETYLGFLGIQNMLIQKWNPYFRSVLNSSYLYSYKTSQFIWDHQAGLSVGADSLELRFTYQKRDQREQTLTSLIYFF